MAEITWDGTGERLYETGVDHGVLYKPDENGDYVDGVAWNGLTTVTESPSGAEASKQYADNIVYVNLISVEEFGGTIEAYTYPDEFAECDGTATPSPGVAVGQQGRRVFGLSYRTLVGDDIEGTDAGYKLHLVYGAQASPSEKAYGTVNDSPEAIAFSWEFSTAPVSVGGGLKPTSLIVVDSTKVDSTALAELEDELYGTGASEPNLPSPDQVLAILAGTVTEVNMAAGANQPTFVAATGVLTLPAVTGVQWKVNGANRAAGAQAAIAAGAEIEVTAHPTSGSYDLDGDTDWTFKRNP